MCKRAENAPVAPIGRQSPRDLMEAIERCDVFLSGGGSLLQDVTSVRNVVYYTGVIAHGAIERKTGDDVCAGRRAVE